ncbi:MAG: transporter substrate-binding domain-containing protein, partial [Pseudomonadota bacterium]
TLDFSIFYFVDGAAAAIRPGTYETVFDDRRGKFGYVNGTTTEAVVRDLVVRNGIDATLVAFASHKEGLGALASSEIDVYFGDQAILLFQISELGLGEQIAVMEEIFSFEPYALALKRGETALRLVVDRALSAIYDQGIIYKLILDELGDYPLPPETRALYQIVGLPD